MQDKPPIPKPKDSGVDSDDTEGSPLVAAERPVVATLEGLESGAVSGLEIGVPSAGLASAEEAPARNPGKFPDEYPAQFARPPRFYSDNDTTATATFLKSQLGATFHEFVEQDVEDEFPRETDSEMYFGPPLTEPTGPLTIEPTEITPARKTTTWAAVILAVVAFTWFGKTLSNVLVPMALAMFLAYLIVPMVGLFARARIPRSFGYVMAIGVISGAFYGVGAVIAATVAEFRSNFPNYEQNIEDLTHLLSIFSRNVGLIGSGDSLDLRDIVNSLPVGGIQGIISGGATYMFEFLGYFAVTMIFMMFMIWEAERFSHRVRTAYTHSASEQILRVVHLLNRDIQRYVVLKAAVSALTALLSYVAMRAFGLDFAGVLALLIFVANFIPYIGSIVATLLPGMVALLQFPSWSEGLFIVVLITLIQQVFGNIVEPRLQGRSLNVSPLIILIALAYFGWMWGIVGMAVSVPIAAGIRLVLDQFEVTKSAARMMRNI